MRTFATIALLGTASAIQLYGGDRAAIYRDIEYYPKLVLANFMQPLVDKHKDPSASSY